MLAGWPLWVSVAADIAIIFMAAMVGLAGLAVALLAYVVYRRLGPILDSVTSTARNVQGTSSFLGEQAVRPVIRTAGFVAGVRRAIATLLWLLRRKS